MKKGFVKLMDKIPLISNATKIWISFGLVIFSIIVFAFRPHSLDSTICIVAMFVSFIGDNLMNSQDVNVRSHKMLYSGAAAFMVAHIIYAFAYYTMIKANSYVFCNAGAYTAFGFIFAIVSALIIFVLKFQKGIKALMFIVFGIYVLFISVNFVTICSYSYSAKALSFLGALSFLISDLIIGIENLFKIKNDIFRKLVWIFYPIGQVLIILCR